MISEPAPGIFMIRQKGLFRAMPPVNIYVIPGENGLIYDGGYGHRVALNHLAKGLDQIKKICRERTFPLISKGSFPATAIRTIFQALKKSDSDSALPFS